MVGNTKRCCNPDGHCKTKAPVKNGSGRDCKQIAFDREKTIDLHFDLPVMPVAKIELPVLSNDAFPHWPEAAPVNPSPPDLQVLYSTFLI